MNDLNAEAWDASYARNENFCFWPSDEVVRFVSRYLRRRISWDESIDVLPGARGSRVLDVGCGIGRNLVFGTQIGLEMYGVDLSKRAVAIARSALTSARGEPSEDRVYCGDVRSLVWPDAFFDHAISDSALDSMSFKIAKSGVRDVARVMKRGGLFYCNLISNDSVSAAEPEGELVVQSIHEQGTIQSYFDEAKLRALVQDEFDIVWLELRIALSHPSQQRYGRWHMVLRRKAEY